MSLTPLCPPPPLVREKYTFFALPSMNVPLPAELKFGENPANTHYFSLIRVSSAHLSRVIIIFVAPKTGTMCT